jgi:hypothetical protein
VESINALPTSAAQMPTSTNDKLPTFQSPRRISLNNSAEAIYLRFRSDIENEVTKLLRRYVRAVNAKTDEEENAAASTALFHAMFNSLVKAAGEIGFCQACAAKHIGDLAGDLRDEAEDDCQSPVDSASPASTIH